MAQFTLNTNDIQACIELASDGLVLHLHNQEKLDLIHKIMYAVAEATQHPNIANSLGTARNCQYSVHLNKHRSIKPPTSI